MGPRTLLVVRGLHDGFEDGLLRIEHFSCEQSPFSAAVALEVILVVLDMQRGRDRVFDWWVIFYSASHEVREDVDRFVRELEPHVDELLDAANHSESVVIKAPMVVDVPGLNAEVLTDLSQEDFGHRFHARTRD